MLPEQKLILDLLNNRFAESDVSGVTPETWSAFVFEATRHRVGPLLYDKIKTAEAERMIPADVIRNLRKKYLATAARNAVLFHQLNELVANLNSNDIPVILLKGAHLAEFVYKDIAHRPMSDIDILVKEAHLSEAVGIAFSAGYQLFFDLNPEIEKGHKDYDYDVLPDFKHFHALIHPETQCMLEIHCVLSSESSPFEILPSELWQAAQPAALNENTVFLLSPEDLILHLCLHSAYDHLFEFGLIALYDISITINHYGNRINWKELQRRSGQRRTDRCLCLSLHFVGKWLGADIPDEIFEKFQIDEMAHVAEERIFKTSETVPLHSHYIQWRNRRGMRDKMRYVLSVLFPPRNFMASRYIKPKESRILFISYLFRFFQAVKGLGVISNAVLKDAHYVSRLKRGDNDFRLREWLTNRN